MFFFSIFFVTCWSKNKGTQSWTYYLCCHGWGQFFTPAKKGCFEISNRPDDWRNEGSSKRDWYFSDSTWWYDMIRYDTLRYDMIWYDMIWYDMIWYDIWYDMIWYMIWYDMIWYDMIWYVNIQLKESKRCFWHFIDFSYYLQLCRWKKSSLLPLKARSRDRQIVRLLDKILHHLGYINSQ